MFHVTVIFQDSNGKVASSTVRLPPATPYSSVESFADALATACQGVSNAAVTGYNIVYTGTKAGPPPALDSNCYTKLYCVLSSAAGFTVIPVPSPSGITYYPTGYGSGFLADETAPSYALLEELALILSNKVVTPVGPLGTLNLEGAMKSRY